MTWLTLRTLANIEEAFWAKAAPVLEAKRGDRALTLAEQDHLAHELQETLTQAALGQVQRVSLAARVYVTCPTPTELYAEIQWCVQ